MEFESMCRGGKVLEKAVQKVTAKAKEGRKKDQMRAEVAALILKATSKYILISSGSKTDRDNRRNNPCKDRASEACATKAWRPYRGHEDLKAVLAGSRTLAVPRGKNSHKLQPLSLHAHYGVEVWETIHCLQSAPASDFTPGKSNVSGRTSQSAVAPS
jgi:hypothetical protein